MLSNHSLATLEISASSGVAETQCRTSQDMFSQNLLWFCGERDFPIRGVAQLCLRRGGVGRNTHTDGYLTSNALVVHIISCLDRLHTTYTHIVAVLALVTRCCLLLLVLVIACYC